MSEEINWQTRYIQLRAWVSWLVSAVYGEKVDPDSPALTAADVIETAHRLRDLHGGEHRRYTEDIKRYKSQRQENRRRASEAYAKLREVESERDAARAAARRLLAALEGHAYVTADEMRVIRKTLGDA